MKVAGLEAKQDTNQVFARINLMLEINSMRMPLRRNLLSFYTMLASFGLGIHAGFPVLKRHADERLPALSEGLLIRALQAKDSHGNKCRLTNQLLMSLLTFLKRVIHQLPYSEVNIHDIDQSCWIMLNLVEEVVVEEAGQSVEEIQSYILIGDAKDEDAEEVRSAGPGRGGLGGSATAGGGRGGAHIL
ncbi:auxin response factor 2 [Artemisia annua]|uniref:Auxin response factor 2 n=1 Tax=Artemisia annua TaxID=35608 RepID=A0A2U1P954_ARTAN|nr:auxin response factor 2 [Artemisia annua]